MALYCLHLTVVSVYITLVPLDPKKEKKNPISPVKIFLVYPFSDPSGLQSSSVEYERGLF